MRKRRGRVLTAIAAGAAVSAGMHLASAVLAAVSSTTTKSRANQSRLSALIDSIAAGSGQLTSAQYAALANLSASQIDALAAFSTSQLNAMQQLPDTQYTALKAFNATYIAAVTGIASGDYAYLGTLAGSELSSSQVSALASITANQLAALASLSQYTINHVIANSASVVGWQIDQMGVPAMYPLATDPDTGSSWGTNERNYINDAIVTLNAVITSLVNAGLM